MVLWIYTPLYGLAGWVEQNAQPVFGLFPHVTRLQSRTKLHPMPVSAKRGDRLIRERLNQIIALYSEGPIIPPFADARNNVYRLEAYFLNLTNLERVSLHEN